jgi:hypothetical protein
MGSERDKEARDRAEAQFQKRAEAVVRAMRPEGSTPRYLAPLMKRPRV